MTLRRHSTIWQGPTGNFWGSEAFWILFLTLQAIQLGMELARWR